MQYVVTEHGLGRVEADEVVVLDTVFPNLSAVLEQTGTFASLSTASARLRTPMGRPRAVWGVGLNYRSKAARAGRSLPTQPILFLAASSCVLAPGDAVQLPVGVREPDYEGEIAIVIGRPLFHCQPEDVWPAIAGITAANDMTARDVMRNTAMPVLAKSFPGFTPLGPSVCELDDLPSRDAIGIRTWVNGVAVQDDTSAGMIFPVADLISRLSYYAALEPGDVVLTGTPAGTGQDRSVFLRAGDEVRIEIDGVLPLVTRVFADDESSIADPALLAPL
jgi:2-keto-4-pentenoate hydratase/2-oxohepta-3-ene-1,7-dioic acid hydratase in catechol pathway